MASKGKENVPQNVIISGNSADLGWKESNSKIPVLSRRRIRPELKQSQQQQEGCLSKKTGTSSDLVPGASGLEVKVGVQPKNNARKGLGEMQLNPSGHKNVSVAPDGKELSTDDFVPDFAALASILSNTGLTNHMVSASSKPSLARRIPLKGNRACSVSTGVRQVSRCLVVPETNFGRMSHISRPTLKDSNHQPSCSLVLNTQQLKKLSASLENPLETLKPGVKGTKPSQLTNLQDFIAGPKAKGTSGISKDHLPVQSSLAGRKETIRTPSKESEFVADPAVKASILLNIGISHSALEANGKLSLAQRVPVKEAQKTPGTIKGENVCLQGAPQSEKFGRVSCRSTQGLKGLEKSEASGVQLTTTPGRRCSTLDCSPYGLARRVPLACPQSSCRTPWAQNHMLPLSCTKNKKVNGLGGISPQKDTAELKQDATNTPWKSIAVRLFEDEMAASSKKAPTPPVIPPKIGKLQRIELLTQLLRDEVNSRTEHDITPSLVELQKLLLVHRSTVQDTSEAGLLTASPPDTRPDVHKEAPTSTVAPEILTTTTSSQLHDCQSLTVPSACPPLSHVVNTDKVKQRMDDLLSAPHRFHEACLNVECAFYTTRIHSFPQVSGQRCKEPVAKVLDAQEATHFIPISPPPPATEDLSQDAHDRIADTEIVC